MGSSCDERWTNLFAGLHGGGWAGGDGTYSVLLPDGRDAWLFGDTILGPDRSDGARTPGFALVHNSAVISDGLTAATVAPVPTGEPTALVDAGAQTGYYWLGAGRAQGSEMSLFLDRIKLTGTGAWDFAPDGTYLAQIDTATWKATSVSLVSSDTHLTWGTALLDDGPYTYVYGVEAGASAYQSWLHVARASTGDLTGAWSYWDGSQWSSNAQGSARILSGVSPQVSMLRTAHGYALVSQQPVFGRDIQAYGAAAPQGPFGTASTLYTTPSFGASTYTYNAVAHPEQVDSAGLLVSYNVNSFDDRAFVDDTLYRPRFIRVPLDALPQPPAAP